MGRLIDEDDVIKAIDDVLVEDEQYKVWYKLAIKNIPSAQSEPCEDKLKEIADALSEKMCYMNTCPNERDIILGYLGRECSSKNHCNTDCWNKKCESYHYETKQQSEPCEDVVSRAVIMQHYDSEEYKHVNHISRNNLLDYIEQLPSVTPKRNTGKWVYKPNEYDDSTYECSQCEEPWTLIDGTPEENNMKFCPNCGAEMEE